MFDEDSVYITWFGLEGLRWKESWSFIKDSTETLSLPDILIHAGGDDIGKVRIVNLIWDIRYDLSILKCLLP